jgi:hypothetical protein
VKFLELTMLTRPVPRMSFIQLLVRDLNELRIVEKFTKDLRCVSKAVNN